MGKLVILFAVAALSQLVSSHVSLTFPPARYPDYDFLDNVRTGGPCGVPNSDDPDITILEAESTFNVTYHLAYSHRGGVLVNILSLNGTLLYRLLGRDWANSNDSTSNSIEVTLPTNFTCDHCVLQFLRQASEWTAIGGYTFWSCADIAVMSGSGAACNGGTCSGNGLCNQGTCTCNPRFSGQFCQTEDDCATDLDCNNGTCLDLKSTTTNPRRQCYCNRGSMGRYCDKQSPLTDATIDPELYTIHRSFGPKLRMWARVLEASRELEIALEVSATGYVAFGWKPTGLDGECRLDSPFPFNVGSNPNWPDGNVSAILGVPIIEFPDANVEEGEEAEVTSEDGGEPEDGNEPGGEAAIPLHPMDCADIVIGAAREDRFRILDYYTRDRSTPRLDSFYKGVQSLTAAVGKEENGITTIIFRKPLNGDGDIADHTIENELMSVIWSFGQVYPDYAHSPGSGIEAGTATDTMFYLPDELKYHGIDNRGTASINFFEADSVDGTDCTGSFETGCTSGMCTYKADWRVAGNRVEFNVSARVDANQWVAIGFSDNMMMADTDIVLGASDGTNAFITDRYATGRSMPPIDSESNLDSTRVTRENGYTTISFIRDRDTGDSEDLSLNDNLFFVYGWGGPVLSFEDMTIGQHPTTPIITNTRVVLLDSSECPGDGAIAFSFSMLVCTLCAALAMFLL